METKVKRPYGGINEKILAEAIGKGLSYTEAGRLAGAKGKDEKSIAPVVSRKISKNINLKKTIIEKLEERQHWILDSIGPDEILKAPLSQKSVSFGIFIDKSQLLKGDPTQNIGIIPRMVFEGNKVSFKQIPPQTEKSPNK